MAEAEIRAAFGKQAEWCRQLAAPFMAQLCDALALALDRSTATGRAVLDWPGEPYVDALMMRLTGGLHALVRRGALGDLAACYPPNAAPDAATLMAALTIALADDRLLPWLDGPPQTNEVARSGVLMPGLLVIADAFHLPLALHELGASAGLNLRMDYYAYDLGGVHCGPTDAPLTLTPAWSGAPPPDAPMVVAARRGVDLNPLDLADAATRDRLLAYVWPDQPARRARLEAAIAAFVADPVALDAGDAADWVATQVALTPGVVTCVYHSVAFQYFPRATQTRIAAHLERLGATASAEAPLAWLRYEFESVDTGGLATLRLKLWPDGTDRLLAHAHPHGASVRWVA